MKKLSLLLLALALSASLFAALKPTPYQAKNVVVLVIDGPRQSEMWASKDRIYIPHLDRELAPQGVLLSGFRNNGPTYTNAGHTALCTGYYEEMENSKGSQLPAHAGIFQYFLKASGLPKSAAWLITTKDKLAILGDSSAGAWHGRFQPSLYSGQGGKGLGSGYGEDADTMSAVKGVLGRDHPRLLLINLKNPDSGGHSGKWANYIDGLRASDAYAAELWAFLQADAAYRDSTALFITHDHGRHLDGVKDGFISHGDSCGGCRAIALLALGPDFKRGAVIRDGGEQIDLPVTIAAMLGFSIPGLKGRFLSELFR